MAKFTVFFKIKPVNTYVFEAGVIYIGRDNTNTIAIDNLSIAPIHAIAVVRESDCLIKQINDNFPLIINDETHKEYCLTDNDKITLGKYDILYNLNSYSSEQTLRTDFKDHFEQLDQLQYNTETQEANLQIMDGKHIGRIIPIKKTTTRLGHNHGGLVIIIKKKDGYYISVLESNSKLTINQQPLNNQIVKLSHNDIIRIDNTSMQFFLG